MLLAVLTDPGGLQIQSYCCMPLYSDQRDAFIGQALSMSPLKEPAGVKTQYGDDIAMLWSDLRPPACASPAQQHQPSLGHL